MQARRTSEYLFVLLRNSVQHELGALNRLAHRVHDAALHSLEIEPHQISPRLQLQHYQLHNLLRVPLI